MTETAADAAAARVSAQGTALGAFYGYLKGVNNKLADKHIPEVKPRLDREGGQPYGRKADQARQQFLTL